VTNAAVTLPMSTLESGLAAQLRPKAQPVVAPPLTFHERAERVALVIMIVFAAFKFTPRIVRYFKTRGDVWSEVDAQAIGVFSALEGLIKQLSDKSENVTPSTLRTAEAALALLQDLSRPEIKPDLARDPRVRLLVVDDDPISRVAVSSSLKKVFDQPDVAPDGP